MLAILVFILVVAIVWGDLRTVRRMRRNGAGLLRRRSYALWCAATACAPLVLSLAGFFVDNTPLFVRTGMWVLWGWMATALPRLVYRIFARLRLPKVGIAAVAAMAGLLIWGATTGRTTLRVSRETVRSERLPAAFDGFRIVHFSDAHLGALVDEEGELGRIVEQVNALRPDLVVFSGDLVNIRYTELHAGAMRTLRRIAAPVISVTGNHDVGTYITDSMRLPAQVSRDSLLARERAMGWRVLEDTTVYLRRCGDSIALTGIAFDPALYKRRHDRRLPPLDLERIYGGLPDGCFDLTVVHLPQYWEQLLDAGRSDLTLAGHVHAMQIKARAGGVALSPARLQYRRWSGRYDERGRTLYINDGTGYVGFPMRLGAWPEITLITLERCR